MDDLARQFVAAELSVLSYSRDLALRASELDPGTSLSVDDFRAALLNDSDPGRDHSARSAVDFTKRYEVVAGVESSPETSGFQATLFRRIPEFSSPEGVDPGTPAGTPSVFESVADGQSEYVLALTGTEFEVDPLLDLVIADGLIGLTGVASSQLPALESFLDSIDQIVGDSQVEFVGHSLGGHLAMLAAAARPELVSRVSTVNSAGEQLRGHPSRPDT